MNFQLDLNLFEDKIEFFEAESIKNLEEKSSHKSKSIKRSCFKSTPYRTKCMSVKRAEDFTVQSFTLKPKSNLYYQ